MKDKIRYLWVYSAADENTVLWHEKLLKRRQDRGYDIIGFCNTPLSLNRRWLPFPELDRRWKSGDPVLLRIYSSLLEIIQDRDVLILYNGANLHPEFVKLLHILKVYTAGDDPESTEILTKPISPVFNIHLINNIACLQMYRDWGLNQVHFWPLGSLSTIDELSDINENNIVDISKRTIPTIFCGGYTHWRKNRMDTLINSFPNSFVCGNGMPKGHISNLEQDQYYRMSQIGWNLHNSIGPINFRTYELPAYGIMQICDNKEKLGEIFKLDKEVIGFNTINECVELTQYFLDSVEEQREIALGGWMRWKSEYHPDQIWEKLITIVEPYYNSIYKPESNNIPNLIKIINSKENPWSCINMSAYHFSCRCKLFLEKFL